MAAESSGFFNAEYDETSDIWDRVYTAEQFASYFAQFIGNGIFAGVLSELKVYQYSQETANMTVRVTPGRAYINGFWYYLEEEAIIQVPTASSTSQRIDMVVVRLDVDSRRINVRYVSDANEPVRNANYYDLMLCRVTVPANTTEIRDAYIEDTRQLSAYCGWVTGLVDQLDFDSAYSQFTAWFNDYKEEIIADFSEAGEMAQIIFEAWFRDIRGKLTSDVAGSLQLEIDDINKIFADYYSVTSLYNVGDNVTYANKLYECITPVTEYEEFNEAKWRQLQVQPQINGMVNKIDGFESAETTFNSDGSINTTYGNRLRHTTFNSDGSITETLSKGGVVYATKTTTFNQDGSITETVS